MSKLIGFFLVFVDVVVMVKCCWEWLSGIDSDKFEDVVVIGRNRFRYRIGSSKELFFINDVVIV